MAIFPGRLRLHLFDQEAYALVVGGVEPEHSLEDALGLVESTETPQAQAETVHAAKKRPSTTCSISKVCLGPRAIIGLAHSSIGSSSLPQL